MAHCKDGLPDFHGCAQRTAALMKLGSQGNVRTQTLRAFSRDEMQNVLSKVT